VATIGGAEQPSGVLAAAQACGDLGQCLERAGKLEPQPARDDRGQRLVVEPLGRAPFPATSGQPPASQPRQTSTTGPTVNSSSEKLARRSRARSTNKRTASLSSATSTPTPILLGKAERWHAPLRLTRQS